MLSEAFSPFAGLVVALIEPVGLWGQLGATAFALGAVILLLFGAVFALAFVLGRRRASGKKRRRGAAVAASPASGAAVGASARTRAGGERVCPTCHRVYDEVYAYCPRDARPLIAGGAGAEVAGNRGLSCPQCGRAFEPGNRYCPHDGADLVPAALARLGGERDEAEQDAGGDAASADAASPGRICPKCRRHYDLGASFCGRDGSELAALN